MYEKGGRLSRKIDHKNAPPLSSSFSPDIIPLVGSGVSWDEILAFKSSHTAWHRFSLVLYLCQMPGLLECGIASMKSD